MSDDIRAALARDLRDLPTITKDPLEVQARNFGRAARGYATAVQVHGIGSPAASEAYERYRLSATLYAPSLIAALLGLASPEGRTDG